jgi:hypothetical protein
MNVIIVTIRIVVHHDMQGPCLRRTSGFRLRLEVMAHSYYRVTLDKDGINPLLSFRIVVIAREGISVFLWCSMYN